MNIESQNSRLTNANFDQLHHITTLQAELPAIVVAVLLIFLASAVGN